MTYQPPGQGSPGSPQNGPPPGWQPQSFGAAQSSPFATSRPPGAALSPVAVQPPPPYFPAPPRRHRGMFWVAVLAALVALAGGAIVAITAYTGASTPDAVTKAYFRALGRGDAPGALALGDLPAGSRTFLTSDVLRVALKIARLTDVEVLTVDEDAGTARVTVQYELRFAQQPVIVNDTVELRKGGHGWRLDDTAVATSLDPAAAGRRLSLAGAAVPSGTVLLFPGALPITVDTPNLDLDDRVVHLNGFIPSDLQPVVTKAGKRAVADAVGAALKSCLNGKTVAPCPAPNDDRAVPGSVRGTLPADVAAKLNVAVASGPDGLLDVSGTVDVRGRYQRLNFNNLAVPRSGTIHLVVRAHCYATNPNKLVWDAAS